MTILFYISLFLYTFTVSVISNVVDYDLWARIVVGKTFFQTGKLLNFDFQSFGPTRQWFDHEWGSSLVFYQILEHFGDFGLIVFKAIVLFIVFFILTKIILMRRKHLGVKDSNSITESPFNILFFILMIQAVLEVAFATVRCNLFTFLFFAIWLYALEKSRLEGNFRLLWIIPATMLIWANMHGGCFVGLGFIFLYALGEFLNKKKFLPYVITLLFSLLAMFVNPYGVKYVYFLFHAITLKRTNITEWQPLFDKIYVLKFFKYKFWAVAVAIISGWYLFKKYKCTYAKTHLEKIKELYNSLDKTKALILIVTFLLSIKTLRLIPFFFFFSAVFLYDDIYKVFNKKLSNTANNIKEIVLFVFILFSFIYTIRTIPLGTSVKGYPFVETEFLRINNLKGNVFANLHYGSYLAYKLYPDNFIFMDGRYEETYNPALLNRMNNIFVGPNWEEEFNKQHIDYIILEHAYGTLYYRLKQSGKWKHAVTSNNFVLLIRDDIKIKDPKIPVNSFDYYNKTKWETNIDWKGALNE